MAPTSTSWEPNQSTATTEEKIRKIAMNVSRERARMDARAAVKAFSTAAAKRPVTSFSLVKDCSVRIAPICSDA